MKPRQKKERTFRFEFREQRSGVTASDVPQTVLPFDVEVNFREMDSLMRTLTEEQLKHDEQFRKMDSLIRARLQRLSRVKPKISIDSINRR